MKQLVTITLLYMALPSEYPIDLSLLFFLSVHEKKKLQNSFWLLHYYMRLFIIESERVGKKVFVFESSDATSNTRVI